MKGAVYALLGIVLTAANGCRVGLSVKGSQFSSEKIECFRQSEDFMVISAYSRGKPVTSAPGHVEAGREAGFEEFVIKVTPDPGTLADADPLRVAASLVLFSKANKIPLNQIWIEVSSDHSWVREHKRNADYLLTLARSLTEMASKPTILSRRKCWQKIMGAHWNNEFREYGVVTKDHFSSHAAKQWKMYYFGQWTEPAAVFYSADKRCGSTVELICKP